MRQSESARSELADVLESRDALQLVAARAREEADRQLAQVREALGRARRGDSAES